MNKLLILLSLLLSTNAFAWTFTAIKVDKNGKTADEYSYKITAEYNGNITPFPDLICWFYPAQKTGYIFNKGVACSFNGGLSVGTLAWSNESGAAFFYSLSTDPNSRAKYTIMLAH